MAFAFRQDDQLVELAPASRPPRDLIFKWMALGHVFQSLRGEPRSTQTRGARSTRCGGRTYHARFARLQALNEMKVGAACRIWLARLGSPAFAFSLRVFRRHVLPENSSGASRGGGREGFPDVIHGVAEQTCGSIGRRLHCRAVSLPMATPLDCLAAHGPSRRSRDSLCQGESRSLANGIIFTRKKSRDLLIITWSAKLFLLLVLRRTLSRGRRIIKQTGSRRTVSSRMLLAQNLGVEACSAYHHSFLAAYQFRSAATDDVLAHITCCRRAHHSFFCLQRSYRAPPRRPCRN